MVLYEYVGKMLRKEGKIVVENVKKLMRKAMGIVLSVVLTLGCILGSGTIAWAEGETADAAAKIKVACVGDSLTEGYTSTGANSGKKGPNAYPARLQSLLGSGYEVKNFGETGAFLMEGTSNPYKSGTEYEQSKDIFAGHMTHGLRIHWKTRLTMHLKPGIVSLYSRMILKQKLQNQVHVLKKWQKVYAM